MWWCVGVRISAGSVYLSAKIEFEDCSCTCTGIRCLKNYHNKKTQKGAENVSIQGMFYSFGSENQNQVIRLPLNKSFIIFPGRHALCTGKTNEFFQISGVAVNSVRLVHIKIFTTVFTFSNIVESFRISGNPFFC